MNSFPPSAMSLVETLSAQPGNVEAVFHMAPEVYARSLNALALSQAVYADSGDPDAILNRHEAIFPSDVTWVEFAPSNGGYSTQKYLFAQDASGTRYVSFAGTNNLKDVVTDMGFASTSQEDQGGSFHHVRTGFLKRWSKIPLTPILSFFLEGGPKDHLVLCGHSLGGAIAVLATVFLFREGHLSSDAIRRIHCITFGQPLVGDEVFVRNLQSHGLDRCFHAFINGDDIVPRILTQSANVQTKLLNSLPGLFEFIRGTMRLKGRPGSAKTERLLMSKVQTTLLHFHPVGTYYLLDEGNRVVSLTSADAIMKVLQVPGSMAVSFVKNHLVSSYASSLAAIAQKAVTDVIWPDVSKLKVERKNSRMPVISSASVTRSRPTTFTITLKGSNVAFIHKAELAGVRATLRPEGGNTRRNDEVTFQCEGPKRKARYTPELRGLAHFGVVTHILPSEEFETYFNMHSDLDDFEAITASLHCFGTKGSDARAAMRTMCGSLHQYTQTRAALVKGSGPVINAFVPASEAVEQSGAQMERVLSDQVLPRIGALVNNAREKKTKTEKGETGTTEFEANKDVEVLRAILALVRGEREHFSACARTLHDVKKKLNV